MLSPSIQYDALSQLILAARTEQPLEHLLIYVYLLILSAQSRTSIMVVITALYEPRTRSTASITALYTITHECYGRHCCSQCNHRYNGDLAIGPHLIPDYPFSLPELLKGAFIPFTDEATHMKLFDSGQRCAEAWLRLETPRQARN